jgi:tripartite-type tricarboxylate transporter receptor subunit TctC
MIKTLFASLTAGLLLAALSAEAAPAPAATPPGGPAPDYAFFRGKTITYIVATGPGGGYDTYGRLLVRHMPKYLPGTRFVVRNIPGAGQIVGTNTIYVARNDGLTFGTFNTGLIYSQLLKLPGTRFDLSKMSWIGKMAEEGRSLVLSKVSGMQSLDDLRRVSARGPVKLAAAGVGSASYIETRILADVLGLNIQIVTGFFGGDTELSMLRGEVAGVLGAASSHDEFVRRGEGKFVVSVAGARSSIPGVPQARQFVTDPADLQLLSLVETLAELGRLTAGPPDIPPARLAALRDAFQKAVDDPELRAEAQKILIPIDNGRGEEIVAKVNQALRQPPQIIENLRAAAEVN